MAFPPSTEPAFLTVPRTGFGEPLVLHPGSWSLLVEAEGVLLVRPGPRRGWEGPWPQPRAWQPSPLLPQDYVVLLPSAYYEAALLQLRVTEACLAHAPARSSGEK